MSRTVALIGGGVRSGKSEFALARAQSLGERRLFVATAQAFDDEMRQRIDAHRAERDATFVTVETPLGVAEVLETASDVDVVVVDCLTLWLSNQLGTGADDVAVGAAIDRLVQAVRGASPSVVLVTNEVGLGIVPDNALARRFRDHTGRMHRRLATFADEVYLGAMGVLLRISPGPIERVTSWTP